MHMVSFVTCRQLFDLSEEIYYMISRLFGYDSFGKQYSTSCRSDRRGAICLKITKLFCQVPFKVICFVFLGILFLDYF